jgi:hypothetical protein
VTRSADQVAFARGSLCLAPGGARGREVGSGLARALSMPGSILVSHRQVFSLAAVKLVTRAFISLTSMDNGHRIGRAEAMRRSMSSAIAEGRLARSWRSGQGRTWRWWLTSPHSVRFEREWHRYNERFSDCASQLLSLSRTKASATASRHC